jgi:hypothetical protein
MTSSDIRLRLGRLVAERHDALDSDLGRNDIYMDDLEEDLAMHRHAYVVLAVTEIATLRADFDGPLVG